MVAPEAERRGDFFLRQRRDHENRWAANRAQGAIESSSASSGLRLRSRREASSASTLLVYAAAPDTKRLRRHEITRKGFRPFGNFR